MSELFVSLLLQTGTNFDPKEEIFRNWGGLIGPMDHFSIAIAWDAGREFKVTVVVVDPANTVAVALETTVTESKEPFVQEIKPELEQPLRPGVWTVKLLYLWNAVAETYFLVTPYSHYEGRLITNAEAEEFHKGPKAGAYQKGHDFSHFQDRLSLDDPDTALVIAQFNSQKVGLSLLAWLDELTAQFWRVADSCVVNERLPLCNKLPLCSATRWSTMSPDPKSELGEVDEDTGRLKRYR